MIRKLGLVSILLLTLTCCGYIIATLLLYGMHYDSGIDRNIKSYTPLSEAVLQKDYKKVQRLLERGANPNQAVRYKEGPPFFSKRYANAEQQSFATIHEPLDLAVYAQDIEMTKLLLKYGAEANNKVHAFFPGEKTHSSYSGRINHGKWEPIINEAIIQNNPQMVELLISHGALDKRYGLIKADAVEAGIKFRYDYCIDQLDDAAQKNCLTNNLRVIEIIMKMKLLQENDKNSCSYYRSVDVDIMDWDTELIRLTNSFCDLPKTASCRYRRFGFDEDIEEKRNFTFHAFKDVDITKQGEVRRLSEKEWDSIRLRKLDCGNVSAGSGLTWLYDNKRRWIDLSATKVFEHGMVPNSTYNDWRIFQFQDDALLLVSMYIAPSKEDSAIDHWYIRILEIHWDEEAIDSYNITIERDKLKKAETYGFSIESLKKDEEGFTMKFRGNKYEDHSYDIDFKKETINN